MHQRLTTFHRMTLTLEMKLFREPELRISVTKTISSLPRLTQHPRKLRMFLCRSLKSSCGGERLGTRGHSGVRAFRRARVRVGGPADRWLDSRAASGAAVKRRERQRTTGPWHARHEWHEHTPDSAAISPSLSGRTPDLHFLLDAFLLGLGYASQADGVPRDLHALHRVVRSVHRLERPSSNLLVELISRAVVRLISRAVVRSLRGGWRFGGQK